MANRCTVQVTINSYQIESLFAGMNSLVIYLGHEIFEDYLPVQWSVPSTHTAQLLMNVWGSVFWLLIAICLHRKRVFISLWPISCCDKITFYIFFLKIHRLEHRTSSKLEDWERGGDRIEWIKRTRTHTYTYGLSKITFVMNWSAPNRVGHIVSHRIRICKRNRFANEMTVVAHRIHIFRFEYHYHYQSIVDD